MFSIVKDLIFAVILTAAGLFFLLVPYGTIQNIFPNIVSKKATRICGAFVLLCGIGCDILLLMNFLDM